MPVQQFSNGHLIALHEFGNDLPSYIVGSPAWRTRRHARRGGTRVYELVYLSHISLIE